MAKIAFFEIEEWEADFIKEKLPDHELLFTRDRLTAENLEQYKDIEVISAFLYSALNKDVLSQMPNLKLIATRTTGFDHIDLAYCKERNIVVENVPSYGATTVAEFTFALILALSRKLIPSIEHTRRADFTLDGLEGFDLAGKTIGIVGGGNIGSGVARIANAFGMKVQVYSHHNPNIENTTFVENLDDLLSSSDIVTLHVPLTPETTHMINMQNIEKFKKGSLLINTARGGLIETQALVDGLEKGILRGAGMDVLEGENYIREERELLADEFIEKADLKTQVLDHVLLDRDDVLVTPHNAFNSREALTEILGTTGANITAFFAGTPQNIVEIKA